MRHVVQDLRFALRSLRRRPTFAAIAIATIALSAGAATSIYSVVDGVLLRPLPFREPGKLVAIWQTFPEWKKNEILRSSWDRIVLSMPEYRDLRAQQRSFADVAIFGDWTSIFATPERTDRILTLRASASLLSVLGVEPALGRMYTDEEDRPTGRRVAMVSYETWQSRFGGASDILGRVVRLDDRSYSIVGVLPQGLKLGRSRPIPGVSPERAFWTPVGQDSSNYYERTNHSYQALGRLAPGVTMERAAADVDRILRGDERATKGTRLVEWQTDQTRDFRAPLFLLLAAVGLLLLIACVNVATLLLGEAASREQEMAARTALGASRTRLMRQLLTESLSLAVIGGSIGTVLAWWGTKVLIALAPPRIPGLADVHIDLRVLLFAIGIVVLTGALFGLAPALTLSTARPAALMRSGSGQSGRNRGALQRGLIATELALSVVLLVGAGLLARSFARLTRVDPGFRAERLLVINPSLPRAIQADSVRGMQSLQSMLTRLAALPGVTAVTAGSQPPFVGGTSSSFFRKEGEPDQATNGTFQMGAWARGHQAQQRVVIPGYFATLGIPLRAGRDFTPDDRAGAEKVAIVSEALVRRDYPGESPLGKKVFYQGAWRTIVGVVGDVHFQRLSNDLEASLYTPYLQRSMSASLLVRTAGDPAQLIPALRKAVTEAEPAALVNRVDIMSVAIAQSFADERYRATLISLFGILAALLAAVGMYGVTSRAVARRTREVAIRLALGASRLSIEKTVIGATLSGVIIGVLAGMLGALGLTRFLAPYLFGVSATDPWTYAGILGLLAAVCVGASWVPARRAGRVGLAEVLRGE